MEFSTELLSERKQVVNLEYLKAALTEIELVHWLDYNSV